MKKVVVVWSSPNKDGLTASTKNFILPALKEAGKAYANALENGFDMYY